MSSKRNVSTPVPAKAIRQAFQNGDLDVADVTITRTVKGVEVTTPVDPGSIFGGPQGRGRGRLNKAFVQAFLAANPGTSYAEKVAEVKTIDLPLVSAKTGRAIKPATVSLATFRELSGQAMGRPSGASLALAAEKFVAARG